MWNNVYLFNGFPFGVAIRCLIADFALAVAQNADIHTDNCVGNQCPDAQEFCQRVDVTEER